MNAAGTRRGIDFPEIILLVSEPPTMVIIAFGGALSLVLTLAGVVAYRRRRSWSYLLIVAALATLVLKAAVGGLTILTEFSGGLHHPVEHFLDFAMAAFLLGAIYFARRNQGRNVTVDGASKPASTSPSTSNYPEDPE